MLPARVVSTASLSSSSAQHYHGGLPVTPTAFMTVPRVATDAVVVSPLPAYRTTAQVQMTRAVSRPPLGPTYMVQPLGVTETAVQRAVSYPRMTSFPAVPAVGGFNFKFYGPGETPPEELASFGMQADSGHHTHSYDSGTGYGHTQADLYGDMPTSDGWSAPGHGHHQSHHHQAQSQHLQEADRYEAAAVEHERRVEMLSHQPLSTSNLEMQIQELLEGQQAIRYELDQVKAQVSNNYVELEAIRKSQSRPPVEYYHQPLPQHLLQQQQQPMPPAVTQSMPPTLPLMSFPSQDSQGPPLPPRNLGYESNLDVFNTLTDRARQLHGHATRTMRGGLGSSTKSRLRC